MILYQEKEELLMSTWKDTFYFLAAFYFIFKLVGLAFRIAGWLGTHLFWAIVWLYDIISERLADCSV